MPAHHINLRDVQKMFENQDLKNLIKGTQAKNGLSMNRIRVRQVGNSGSRPLLVCLHHVAPAKSNKGINSFKSHVALSSSRDTALENDRGYPGCFNQ
ncbi:MAG: hypothetical protein JST18_14505 [Bacteroidetes bacterium]|nr:hypothetical protein [Bacteroidota bacterium]